MKAVTFFTVVIFLLGTVVISAQESKVDFSGTWKLNADKSEFGGGRGGSRGFRGYSKMVVEQKDNKLIVETFRKNRNGQEVSNKNSYTLDGKECKNNTNFGTMVSTANWAKDGKTITIKSTRTFSRGDREFTMESTEKWSLDKDSLVIETTRSTPRGERKSKAVYDKAEKQN